MSNDGELIFISSAPYREHDFLRYDISHYLRSGNADITFIALSDYVYNLQNDNKFIERIRNSEASFYSFKGLISFLKWRNGNELKGKKNICIVYLFAPTSLKELTIYLLLLKYRKKSIVCKLTGMHRTSVKTKDENSIVAKLKGLKNRAKKITVKKLIRYFSLSLFKFIYELDNVFPKYELVDSLERLEKLKKINIRHELLEGSTWDFCQWQVYKGSQRKVEKINHQGQYVLLLDGAGPGFHSDADMLGVALIQSESWYPALNIFLKQIQTLTKENIVVSPHPSVRYDDEKMSKFYPEFAVSGDATVDLVSRSSMVLTRHSTAITYAIIEKKPIIFITSNNLMKGLSFKVNIEFLSSQLGSPLMNIDDITDKKLEDLKAYLEFGIDDEKYINFEKKYLTSNNGSEKNSSIILNWHKSLN